MGKTPAELYKERINRIQDAAALRKPDMVPIIMEPAYFVARYAGITYQEMFYDRQKCVRAHEKFAVEMEPDAFHCLPFDSGAAMDAIGTRAFKWPGHGLGPNTGHQYVEDEYMMADEYDSFLQNPTDFIVKKYLPRTCAPLEVFRDGPGMLNYLGFSRGRVSPLLSEPAFVEACRAVYRASQAAREWDVTWRDFVKDIEDRGYPAITVAGYGQAPFDFFSDHFRGMKGIMLDMMRQPDKLLAAMDAIMPMLLQRIKDLIRTSRNGLVFMGPHRGAEGFMSPQQFEKFYWPGLRTSLLALVEKGFTPFIFWEGDYTSRLEYLNELPPGKIIHRMDRTDIYKASQVLKGRHCIAGGMLPSLLKIGTPEQVADECRRLIETVGRDGGFIMGHSTVLDDANIENVRTMVEVTRKYGGYR
jgi:hypothetical protein